MIASVQARKQGRRQGRQAWAGLWAAAVVMSGCRLPTPLSIPYPRESPPRPAVQETAPPSPPNGGERWSLEAAVWHALQGDPALLAMAAQADQAAGDRAAAGTWPSPELRFGLGRGREDGRGGFRQTETGSGSLQRQGNATQITERPFELPLRADREQRGQRDTRFTSATEGTDVDWETDEGFSLGLRYAPPNPWSQKSAIAAAAAEWHFQRSRWEHERLERVCDVVALAIRLAYHERIQAQWERDLAASTALARRVRGAAVGGDVAAMARTDMRIVLSEAQDTVRRLRLRRAALQRDLQALTGIAGDRIDLSALRIGVIFPDWTALATDDPLDAAEARADVRAAGWRVRRSEAEWRLARSKRIPWVSHTEVRYSWWDRSGEQTQDFTQERRQTGTGSSSSVEREWRTFETRTRNEWEWETSRTISQGSERSQDRTEGDEWWFAVGMEIPLFEWLSAESRVRRKSAQDAWHTFSHVRARAAEDVHGFTATLQASHAALENERDTLATDWKELRALAAQIHPAGLEGSLQALKLRRRMTEMVAGYLEQAMGVALTELQLCRAAGRMPGAWTPTEE